MDAVVTRNPERRMYEYLIKLREIVCLKTTTLFIKGVNR